MSPNRQTQRGFSLLEVLVAFAILALSLGVLLQIFSKAIGGTALSEGYSRAVMLAESRLAAVGSEIPLAPGVVGGEPEDGLDWIVAIEPYTGPGAGGGPSLAEDAGLVLYQVTAVASWPGPQGPRKVALRTLRAAFPE